MARSYEELIALAARPAARAWLGGLAAAVALLASGIPNAGTGPTSVARFCYPLIAGAVGSCTALGGKALGELVKAGAPWRSTAVVSALLPCSGAVQTVVLNRGVGRFSSLLVVPVFVAAFVTCNAVGGGILFDEFGRMTAAQRRAYPAGLGLLVAGVLTLAAKPTPPAEPPAPEGRKRR